MHREGPGIGVVHLDGDEAQAAAETFHLIEQHFVAGIPALHISNLQHALGGIALGDETVDVGGGEAERLFAEDVDAGVQGAAGEFGVIRIRRGNQDGIGSQRQQLVEGGAG